MLIVNKGPVYGKLKMKAATGALLTGMVVFCSISAPLAQPSLELSPAQAQLHTAVNNLDTSAVREAVRTGANPNYRYGGFGRSVLAMVGNEQLEFWRDEQVTSETEERIVAIYDVLFELGARLAAHDRDILHGPAIAGAARVTKYLLERGANPNGKDRDGYTPVILATEYEHPEVVTALVAGGATPLDAGTAAQIRMIAAAERGDLVALRRELTRGAVVNGTDPTGKTALVAAIEGGLFRGGYPTVVLALLKLGANPNMSGRRTSGLRLPKLGDDPNMNGSSYRYITPLHAAVFKSEGAFVEDNGLAIADALLKAGAHVSSTSFYRRYTPLHIAASLENTLAAMLLLKAGAKVMPHDEDGKTPLDLAESSAMIELLRAYGAREE